MKIPALARKSKRYEKMNSFPKEFSITGRNPVKEYLLHSPRKVNKVIIHQTAHGKIIKEIIELCRQNKIVFHFQKHLPENSQGVVAYISPINYLTIEELLTGPSPDKKCLLVLDEITDPQNLGAIIRSAVAFNVWGIILPKRNSCLITPTVVKTSAGAVSSVSVALVGNLNNALRMLAENNFTIVGADRSGKDIRDIVWKFPLAIVFGSEGKGLRHLVKQNCNYLVSIPQSDKINSLNVAVSAGIILYEISRVTSLK